MNQEHTLTPIHAAKFNTSVTEKNEIAKPKLRKHHAHGTILQSFQQWKYNPSSGIYSFPRKSGTWWQELHTKGNEQNRWVLNFWWVTRHQNWDWTAKWALWGRQRAPRFPCSESLTLRPKAVAAHTSLPNAPPLASLAWNLTHTTWIRTSTFPSVIWKYWWVNPIE